MTIAATTNRGDFTGTAITGPYTVPFPLYAQAHLKVIVTDAATDLDTVQVLGVDYTFTAFVADNMGKVAAPQITFTNAVAGGDHIALLMEPPGTQLTSIKNQDRFFATTHEAKFDLLAEKSLEHQNSIDGAIKLPDSEAPSLFTMTLPRKSLRINSTLGIDNDGNLITSQQANQVISALSLLNAASSQKTPPIGAQSGFVWLAMSGNKITLTAGTWDLRGSIFLGSGGGAGTDYNNADYVWGTANGADTGSKPALVTPKYGIADSQLTIHFDAFSSVTPAASLLINTAPLIVAMAANTDVYLVPAAIPSLASDARVVTNILAMKLSEATS
jgi:hypothetical protein